MAADAGLLAWLMDHGRVYVLSSRSAAYALVALHIAAVIWVGFGMLRARRPSTAAWVLLSIAIAPDIGVYAARAYQHWVWHRNVDWAAADVLRRLRLLVADQEDFRLKSGQYSADLRAIGFTIRASETPRLRAESDSSWGIEIVSRTGGYFCGVSVRRSSTRSPTDGIPTCAAGSVQLSGGEVHPVAGLHTTRSSHAPVSSAALPLSEWREYRGDPQNSGVCCAGSGAFQWDVDLGTEIRATPAIAGSLLILGAHGTGELTALDRRSGDLVWRTAAPNWIHNDPVVKQHIVIVGFGDNTPSSSFRVYGSPPSGIAAYEESTGRRRWQSVADGSVMTSPVIHDSIVVFVSGDREAHGVALASGAVLWRTHLTGRPVMGNPLLIDSVVYVAGNPNFLCALRVRDGKRLWCKSAGATLTRAGESSPAAADSLIVFSAIEDSTLDQLVVGERFRAAWRDVGLAVRGNMTSHLGRQFLLAVRKRDGSLAWKASLGGGHNIPGNAAGTATIVDGVAYVIGPIGRTLSAISVADGRPLWQLSNMTPMRGALSILRGNVVMIDRVGELMVLSAATGALQCQSHVNVPSDRPGVTVAGETAYIAGMNGRVIARPLADILSCRAFMSVGSPVAAHASHSGGE